MSPTRRFKELTAAIADARQALLPEMFDPTGCYEQPKVVHLRTASFRILAHAELESYLEDQASSLLEAAWKRWSDDGFADATLVAVLAFCEAKTHSPPSKIGGDSQNQKSYEDASIPLGKARGALIHAIKHNHGIRESSVLRLLLPLGVVASELDTKLLADLDSFGADRGSVAHTSSTQVTRYLDPKSELDRVEQLLSDLEGLDTLILRRHVEIQGSRKNT